MKKTQIIKIMGLLHILEIDLKQRWWRRTSYWWRMVKQLIFVGMLVQQLIMLLLGVNINMINSDQGGSDGEF